MAVYTQLTFDEIAALVAPLAPGRLVAADGIAAGVENTTYFLGFEPARSPRDDVDGHRGEITGQYVLTIAETLAPKDLEFIATLTHSLRERGLPVPAPLYRGDRFSAPGAILYAGEKPALLVPRIAGAHPQSISAELCRRVGALLAELHLATQALDYRHESHRSLTWVTATGKTLLPQLAEAEQDLLNSELSELTEFVSTHKKLSQSVIHGDLFRDNVLVQNDAITAVIDFFSAGTGYLLLDLAIVVNDWCFDPTAIQNIQNYKALIDGYTSARAPTAEEIGSWGQLLRIAALRFWVSRLNEQLLAGPHAPRGRGKDPTPCRRLLLQHRRSPLSWPRH